MAVFSFSKNDDVNLVPLVESNIGDIVFKGNIGLCKVSVYTKEGYIPHFHIYNSNGTFSTCIQIYDNKYFHHGEGYDGILSSANRKILNEWLASKYSEYLTNWDSIVYYWENNNPTCKFPNNLKCTTQPDYTKIK